MASHLVHLVCGSTGAGKTSYALRLCSQLNAVRFSIDEWMARLFWMDSPQPIEAAWATERVIRCQDQIWSVATQVAQRNVPCVLDLGFGQKAHRRKFYKLATDAGLPLQLHVLDVPAEERWRRVVDRNREKDHQLSFAVTREMFDFVESLWEPPDKEEIAACNGVRGESSPIRPD
ncbi:MAG TPA: ATP-binding protein [Rhizomicrobium sp.]|nr:ATP-binding protein [Rhizomicrobium sp.]